ncbi:MAG TPA: hypothetical protein VFA50_12690 [Stellaceae bacterium]|nr:hypothetical protein [Stellaceae bacterium]
MASERRRNTGAAAELRRACCDGVSLVHPAALRVPGPANDNAAPLLLKLRRRVLIATGGIAIGWLFWAGLLR